MANAGQWIGENLSMGGLVRHAGRALGFTTKLTIQGAGAAASAITSNPETKQKIRDGSTYAGRSVNSAFAKGSAQAGDLINSCIQKAGSVAGCISENAAKLAGASEENIVISKKVGTVLGAATVGLVTGIGIADAAIAMGAAAGTVGGAATTSGLAALGGGSIAAGGGGMAAGQAVVNSFVAASSASSTAALKSEEK